MSEDVQVQVEEDVGFDAYMSEESSESVVDIDEDSRSRDRSDRRKRRSLRFSRRKRIVKLFGLQKPHYYYTRPKKIAKGPDPIHLEPTASKLSSSITADSSDVKKGPDIGSKSSIYY